MTISQGAVESSRPGATGEDGSEKITQPLKRKHGTILVVDDSEDAQELFRASLEAAGFAVIAARNGKDALEVLTEQPTPNVIIVDLLMPVMDGMELIEVLRSYRRLAEIPVVVVSGVDVPAAIRLPHTHYLRKPFRRVDLLDSVEAMMIGKR